MARTPMGTAMAAISPLLSPTALDGAALFVDDAAAELWLLVAVDEGVLVWVDDCVTEASGPSVTKAVGTPVCPGAYMTGLYFGSSGGS